MTVSPKPMRCFMSTVAMADEARKIIDRQQQEIDQLRAEHRRTLAALMDEKHRQQHVRDGNRD